ncbi:MAG TPA: recombinase family protein [Gemmatimonadaceae bacterium]|nr:recombinase family protein [Gemmatimonadaceae bacterium]
MAASYERQSYKHDEGINAQYEVNARAAERDGRRIPNNTRYRFSDNATSGAAVRRKGFDRLRALVESDQAPFKYVYVKDQTRLGRFDDPRYHFYLAVLFEQHGVKILYASEDDRVDYKSAELHQIVPHLLRKTFDVMQATGERRTTKRRTGYGLRRFAANGFYPGTRAPYGTRRWLVGVETHVPIQEVPQRGTIRATDCAYVLRWATDHSVQVVREIYARILKGQALRVIAETLNQRGVLSPGAERGIRVKDPDTGEERAPTWSHGEIQTIARNPIYCGDLIWGRTRSRGYGEPLPAEQADLERG